MKEGAKMEGNVKKMEQMSTSVYARLDSLEKTVNVIIKTDRQKELKL